MQNNIACWFVMGKSRSLPVITSGYSVRTWHFSINNDFDAALRATVPLVTNGMSGEDINTFCYDIYTNIIKW